MKVDSTLSLAFTRFHPHEFRHRKRVARHTALVPTLLAFTHLGLSPTALMEKMLFAPAGSLFEQNNKSENTCNSSLSFSKCWHWKIVDFLERVLRHISCDVTGHRTHGSIFSQSDCFVSTPPRGPPWQYRAHLGWFCWGVSPLDFVQSVLLHLSLAVSETNIGFRSQDERSHHEERTRELNCNFK